MFKKSFTLIETIVVIAVIGLTLPVLIGTIFILVRQQTKIIRLSQVKREGDYLINVMENTIRDRAVTIHSAEPNDANIVCKDAGSSYSPPTPILYFLDKDKNWLSYELSGNTVASDSANLASPINLTSTKTRIENFSISCARNTIYSPPSVSFDFDVCFVTGAGICTSTRPEETASMHYQTRIKLRNY